MSLLASSVVDMSTACASGDGDKNKTVVKKRTKMK
jgi:hypothetical protein